jgi:hypothetical protein
MGSGSSIATDGLPDDIKALVDVIAGQKNKIAEYDSQILEKESAKMFKGHNIIIDELTARTKPQIKRLLEMFPSSLKNLDSLVEGGNSYAKFIKQLAIPKEQLELDMVSRNDVEYDEDALVDIIGTSSMKEIKAFDERFTKLKSYSLLDVFSAHGKKDSVLLKFIQRILRLDRDEGKTVDKDLATKQAGIIHKAGASRLIGVDEDPIIEIFASSSRLQCGTIAESYLELYNMKLERAINMKFKGNCGRIMVLWTQLVPNALVTCLSYMTQKMLVDNSLIAQFLAKFDKDTLAAVDEACVATHKKSLSEFIKHGILTSSTLQRACKGWIEHPSPDKGFEKILHLFIESKFPDGVPSSGGGASADFARQNSVSPTPTPTALSAGGRKASFLDSVASPKAKEDLQQKFKFLLEKQAQEIKLFMIDRKIKINPNDQYVLSRSSTGTSLSQNSTSRTAESGNLSSIAAFSQKQREIGNDSLSLNPVSHDDDQIDDRLAPLSTMAGRTGRKGSDLSPKGGTVSAVSPKESGRSTVFGSNYKIVSTQKSPELKENHSQTVYSYLVTYFEEKDTEGEGSFDGSDFWKDVRNLPLDEFGMTNDDIDTIRECCTWENEDDGRVYYYEALFEFAESIIAAIENRSDGGETDVIEIVKKIKDEKIPTPRTERIKTNAAKTPAPIGRQFSTASNSVFSSGQITPRFDQSFVLSEKRKQTTVAKFPKIPLYLREYILDTLSAFDFDLNGTLSKNEIESLVPALNIPTLTVDEFFDKMV